ncbi:FtsX-like permease family protein [Streptococcus dentapri]|uniref:FtsX-like permease family protein n=1 Tax=Streptococcus dentapri TaxID=573564 RepID=A0ABV8CZF7_9STRE
MLVLITLICLRFILLAEIERESSEIGLLKAIGLPNKTLKWLYLQKIVLIASVGSLIGYPLAILFLPITTKRIRETFGETSLSLSNGVLGFVIAFLLFCFVCFYSSKVLNRIKKASVVELLVQENGFSKLRKKKHSLPPVHHLSANGLVTRRKLKNSYAFPFWLCLLVSFAIFLPYRLISTMNDSEFITYMGSRPYDISVEVVEGRAIESRAKTAKQILQTFAKPHSFSYDEIKRTSLQAISSEGKVISLPTDIGKNTGTKLHYLKGSSAKTDREISLSLLAADELGKNVGDTLTFTVNGQSYSLKIVGLYQDITNGGKTAKMTRNLPQANAQKYIFYLHLANSKQKKATLRALSSAFSKTGYRISDAQGFIQQTLGGVIQQLQKTFYAMLSVCLLVFSGILFFFLTLHINRHQKEIIFKRTLGIPFSSIYLQELYPLLISSLLGAFSGIIAVQYLGKFLISILLQLINSGIQQISFIEMNWIELVNFLCIIFMNLAIITYLTLIPAKKTSLLAYKND